MKTLSDKRFNRRSFLTSASSLIALPTLSVSVGGAVLRHCTFPAPPFQLGVASGDPAPDGFVIWTRLAPKPLEDGGMPNALVEVSWEVATDANMSRIVRRGTTIAAPQLAHSVHFELSGLESDRWYWSRF